MTGVSVFDDAFKIWMAHQTTRGAHLIISQNGGGYGVCKFSVTEAHDRDICDQYFTWGWTKINEAKLVPMSSTILGRYIKQIKPDPKGDIILVLNSNSRYFNKLDNVANTFNKSFNLGDGERFLKKISPAVFKFLFARLHPIDYGWDEKQWLADNFPNLNTYQGSETLEKQIQKCRLSVHFFNTTTFLETLSINFPTILYFDSIIAPIRLSAKPYYDELRQVKILHDSPEAAASWINNIYENPLSWWLSSETQEVRTRFCNQFARTSSSVHKEWAKELFKVTKV